MDDSGGSFGDRIRMYRRQAGLTAAELAAAAGISVRSLREVENGRLRSARAGSVRRLAEVVGIDAEERTDRPSRVSVRLLGPLTVFRAGIAVPVRSAKQRTLLAVFGLRPNEVVGTADVIDALWGDRPPASCHGLVYTYVSRLRHALGMSATEDDSGIVAHNGGYELRLSEDQLDVLRFRALTASARRADDQAEAARLYLAALECWRGRAAVENEARLADHPAVAALAQARTDVALRWAELALAAGHAEQVIELLEPLAHNDSLHEGLAARLVLALAASGRQASALTRYHEVRGRLSEELGVDPSEELRAALRTVLERGSSRHPRAGGGVQPAQLPAAPALVGRAAEAALLDALLTPRDGLAFAAIDGAAGVGKTALALFWAHRVRDRFPDGQLYLNLRGYDDAPPADPSQAVHQLLRALGVPSADIPKQRAERSALLRSRLTGTRTLLLLDNARNAEQVRPLLPGSTGCLVLVTSRNQLRGLIVRDGATRVTVHPLDTGDSAQLLSVRAGVRVEPTSALVRLCAGLPLALCLVADRAARHRITATDLAAELTGEYSAIDALSTGDGDSSTSLRTVFDRSYRTLPPASAQLFRSLGLYPGHHFTAAAAASLAGTDPPTARTLLDTLTGLHLVEMHGPDRYDLHDLLRTYAAEIAERVVGPPQRRAALGRLLAHHVGAAATIGDAGAETEITNMIATGAACRELFPEQVCALAEALWQYLDIRGFHQEALALHEHAVTAAQSLADPVTLGGALINLGRVTWRLGDYDAAIDNNEWALSVIVDVDDGTVGALAHNLLAAIYTDQSRYADAERHNHGALVLARQVGDHAAERMALDAAGSLCWHRGRFEDALDHYRAAVELAVRTGNRLGHAGSLSNTGATLVAMNRHDEALRTLREALVLAESLGHRTMQANLLDTIGLVHQQLGNYEQAIPLHQRALTISRDIGDTHLLLETLNGLGEASRLAGHTDQAIHHHDEALAMAQGAGVRHQLARADDGLGRLYLTLGQRERGLTHLRRALDCYLDIGEFKADELRTLIEDATTADNATDSNVT
jgi:DNA-binding SARP family transcriptional activator/tetratricopeptide (TPR) repeat protein